MEERPWTKEPRQTPEAGEGRERESPPELPE